MFIGGSAKNPLIQEAIKNFFSDSTYLIPKDLQAHVSAGAAIHSLIYYAFGEKVLEPITSEPIFLIVRGEDKEKLITIINSGVSIPSDDVTITGLTKSYDTQTLIELPICLTNEDNILYNLNVPCPDLSINDEVILRISIDSNRTIHAEASAKGIVRRATIENSLLGTNSNHEIIERAEYEYSKSVADNNGRENESVLFKLYETYQEHGEILKAAEIAEELNKQFNRISLNQIGILYSKAKLSEKAIHFYEKSLNEEKDANALLNLALEYEFLDQNKYVECLKKALSLNPQHGLVQYCLAEYEFEHGNRSQGEKQLHKLFHEWKNDYENNNFIYHTSWLQLCARITENYDFANNMNKFNTDNSNHNFNAYDAENLAKIKHDQNSKKGNHQISL